MKNLHLFAIGCHLAALCFFAWVYTVLPSGIWLFFMGWSIWFGSLSLAWLRQNKAAQTAKGNERGE